MNHTRQYSGLSTTPYLRTCVSIMSSRECYMLSVRMSKQSPSISINLAQFVAVFPFIQIPGWIDISRLSLKLSRLQEVWLLARPIQPASTLLYFGPISRGIIKFILWRATNFRKWSGPNGTTLAVHFTAAHFRRFAGRIIPSYRSILFVALDLICTPIV